jgi:hypothetical protein
MYLLQQREEVILRSRFERSFVSPTTLNHVLHLIRLTGEINIRCMWSDRISAWRSTYYREDDQDHDDPSLSLSHTKYYVEGD